MKGSRVQAVVQELQGEKIDIIPWSQDLATFVVNALQPATVSRVVIDEEESRIEVVVPDDQLSLAIGRRGQNVRLASQLTVSQIDILTEADASEKRQREFVERSALFQTELDVDETLSQLLVAEGFTSLEEVAYVPVDEIASIEGLDDDIAAELQSRAAEALERREAASREERRKLGVEDALAELPHLTEQMLVTLGKANIRTLDDLADLATDELIQKKRVEPRRREPSNRPEDKGGSSPIRPYRRAGQRDHHGRPRPLVRGRAAATRQDRGGRRCGIPGMRPRKPDVRGAARPERTCVLTRRKGRGRADPARARPDGEVAPDVRARAPGRGAWIWLGRAELDAANARASSRRALQRAFKTSDVHVPPISASASSMRCARPRSTASAWKPAPGTSSTAPTGSKPRPRGQGPPADPRRRCQRGRRKRLDQAWRVGGGEPRG
jgi:transcription termination factor NusA